MKTKEEKAAYQKEYMKKYLDKNRDRWNAYWKDYRAKNKEKYQYHKQPKYKYARYEYNAIKRGLVFELTIDEFNSFWNTNCSYCNEPIQGIGIDRKDNNIGYTKENCIPCCTICNFMKHTLSHKDFINKCLQISKCFYDEQS